MKEGEQYDLDMVLMKIREKKRKRKIRSERIAILFVVWLLVFKVFGIMRVSGNSMRPGCHSGDIVFFLRILPDGVDYGDVVILKDISGEYLIKRIEGLPGDVIEVDREGHLTRNGEKVQETDVVYGMSEAEDSVDYPGGKLFLSRGQPPGIIGQQGARCGRPVRDKRESHRGGEFWKMKQENRVRGKRP